MKTIGLSIWLLAAALLMMCASTSRAHVEAAELAADVVWDRAQVRMDLRIAIRELISAEQPLDSVVLPDWGQDPVTAMKRHEEEVLAGFRISYDGKALTPRLVSSKVQNLVIGVSEEDILPRVCAVYGIEFTGVDVESGPARIDLSMDMFKLPLDAGFQPTVLCLVTHRVVDSQMTRTAVIGHEDSMTVKPQWGARTAASAAAPGALVSKTAAPGAASGRSRGPMIMLLLAGVIGAVLLVVLARKRA